MKKYKSNELSHVPNSVPLSYGHTPAATVCILVQPHVSAVFDHQRAVNTTLCIEFLIIIPTRCTNFSNLFLKWNYMFWTVPLPFVRSFSLYTQQWYMSYRFADSLWAGSGWNAVPSWSKPVWHIPLLCVQWKTPDEGQRNCPKHVEFHFKNKFEKSVHLVGVIIRNWSRRTVTWMSNCAVRLTMHGKYIGSVGPHKFTQNVTLQNCIKL